MPPFLVSGSRFYSRGATVVEAARDAIKSRTDLEPCEHEFPRRELGLAYLVADDERPYQAQYQLQIAVHDVHVA